MPTTADGESKTFVRQKVDQRLSLLPAEEVPAEQISDLVVSPPRLAAHVRRDDDLGKFPEFAGSWQRLLLGNVHDGAAQMPACQRRNQVVLETSGPPATFTSTAPGFIFFIAAASIILRVVEFSGTLRIRKSTSGSNSSSRWAGQSDSTQSGLSTGNVSTASIRVSKALSSRDSRRPTPPRPTMPTVLRVRSRVGRRMNSFFSCAKEMADSASRRSSGRSCARQPGLPCAGGAGDEDIRTRSPTEPGSGPCPRPTMDPLQPSLADDAVPIDRHLGMTAEDVGRKHFRGCSWEASTISASGMTVAICSI